MPLTGGLLCLAALLGLPCPATAQLAARPAKAWIETLDSPHRVAGLKVEETVTQLKLKPGDVVADIGAGSGVFTPPLARAVSPGGKVYAVDIEQGLLDHIASKARELRITNTETVLGRATDPALPTRNLDLAFICDVLHHIEKRAEYLATLVRYMKPSGRIAIIDFEPERGPHKNDPSLQTTAAQTAEWMAVIGYVPVEKHELFDDKWFVVYARSDTKSSERR